MTKDEIHGYANECVAKLGELVGNERARGKEVGFSEEETKKVWITIFEAFHEMKVGRMKEITSKNLGTLLK